MEGPQVVKDERDELLATMAPVRRARAGGMGLWRGRDRLWCVGAQGPEGGSRGDGAGGAGRGGFGSPT